MKKTNLVIGLIAAVGVITCLSFRSYNEGDEIAATSKIEEQEETGPEGEGDQTDASAPSTDSPSDETTPNPTPEVS